MKRSAALEPLSHDHHAGLAFAARLRRARRADEDPAPLAVEVAAFWRDHLVPHFEEEEAFVLPVLDDGAAPLAARMVEEHRQIRALVEQVAAEAPSWDGPLGAVADALAAHVRFEEREAFPAAERLGGDALARLGARTRAAATAARPRPVPRRRPRAHPARLPRGRVLCAPGRTRGVRERAPSGRRREEAGAQEPSGARTLPPGRAAGRDWDRGG